MHALTRADGQARLDGRAGDGRRVCRTCGEPYDYPGHDSLATRTACPRCVDIPEPTRRVLTILRRRVDRLRREVERLRDGRCPGP